MPADDLPAQPETITAPPAPAVKALSCPACGAGVTLRAAGYSVSVGCPACGSILDVSNAAVQLITRYHEMASQLAIPLGTRGTLDGVEWEAIGWLARSMDGAYPWEEYLLFNPYHGYRWLISDGSSWSLGETLTATPSYITYDTLGAEGQQFRRFFAEREARVDRVLGEFYWRVAVGERVVTSEWATSNFMLSREANEKEVSWSVSRLLGAKEIGEAFGVRADRNPWPPPPHMPSPHSAWLKTGFKIGLAAIAFLILLSVVMGGGRWVDAGTFAVKGDGQEQTATIGPLTFDQPWQRVEVRARAPGLSNAWIDLDYSLVERKSQQVYEAYGLAERYSGRDSDGDWTEGSRESSISMASVPRGTYDLVIDYRGQHWSGAQTNFWDGPSAQNLPDMQVQVRRGGMYGSNLILALILIAVPLIWTFFRHVRFEQARQAESDFDPVGVAALVKSSEDDDE